MSVNALFALNLSTTTSIKTKETVLNLEKGTRIGFLPHTYPDAMGEKRGGRRKKGEKRGEREEKRRKEKEGRKCGCFRIHIYVRNAFLTA